MKKKILFTILILLPMIAIFATSVAAMTVTINWTIPDTTGVQGYKMYYSYASNMTNKLLACQTSNPAVTSLTCENVELQQSPVYFVIAAVLTEGENESAAVSETFDTQISVVQDFAIVSGGPDIPVVNNNIGNEVEEQASKTIGPTKVWAYKLEEIPNQDGKLKSISITLDGNGSSRNVKFALYTHDATNDLPGELVPGAVTVEGTVSSTDPLLITLPIETDSPQIHAGQQYWIALQTPTYLDYYRSSNAASITAIKEMPTYSWQDWNGNTETLPYNMGKCFFTYE